MTAVSVLLPVYNASRYVGQAVESILRQTHRDFEFLILEGAQAGLSWETILRKRDAYRKAFHDFDPERVARYTQKKRERLMADPGIVRNRLKIESSVTNAAAFLDVRQEFGSFDAYIWRFVDGKPRVNRVRAFGDVAVSTPESDAKCRAHAASSSAPRPTRSAQRWLRKTGISAGKRAGRTTS